MKVKDFSREFDKIAALENKMVRGQNFERLFYKIFAVHGILLEKSVMTDKNSQQIDGAIEINSRIFLVETKWEKTDTLAASKLYSFLGKINSKIEGTLGLFVSYNELKPNFIESARSGIKQNCIIVHGEENILPIIRGQVALAEYIWYLYQQASIRNKIIVPVSVFNSLPKKRAVKIPTEPAADKWSKVYDALISEEEDGEFQLRLDTNYDSINELPKKAVILYPILKNKSNIQPKIEYLIDTIISHESGKTELYESLAHMLTTTHWIKYADEFILEKVKGLGQLGEDEAAEIVDNVLPYLKEKRGSWEEENKVSLVMDFVYDHLSDQYIKKLAAAYAEIYCDRTRKDKFPQKRFAEKLFSNIDAKDRYKKIMSAIVELIEEYKADEDIFGRRDESESKKHVISRVKNKFSRIIDESFPMKKGVPNIRKRGFDSQLSKRYDEAMA